MGRNHALYGLTGWLACWPAVAHPSVAERLAMPTNLGVLGVTCAVAAGASVVPDLDHPDSKAAHHFGPLTKVISKGISQAAGGHRMATHSFAFAAALAAITYAIAWAPAPIGQWCAALACGFCCSVGLALIGPSFGFRVPTWVDLVVAGASGVWVWLHYDDIRWVLPVVAAYGVLVHILCDLVTKGGVPVLWPMSQRRVALHLFRVGGAGERFVGLLGLVLLGMATWRTLGTFA